MRPAPVTAPVIVPGPTNGAARSTVAPPCPAAPPASTAGRPAVAESAAVDRVVVAMLLRRDGETGVQTHVRELSRAMQGSPVGVTVVSPGSVGLVRYGAAVAVRRLLDVVSPARAVAWRRSAYGGALRRALRRTLADGRPCVVYAQCPDSADAALRARRGPGQRVVLVVHFNVSQADEWADKGRIRRSTRIYSTIRDEERQVVSAVDGLVYVSDFMRRHLEDAVPTVRAIPAAVVPNFVSDVEPSRPEPAGDLVTIGSLEPRKNQGFLLRVVARARALGHPYRLTVIGDGADRADLEALARELAVDDLVRFVGRQRDARRLLAGHRAYVHAAVVENCAITLIEALAAGLPVFAGAVGGTAEVVRDAREGRLWPVDDVDEAARALIEVLEDGPTLRRYGVRARARYERCYRPDIVLPRLLDALGVAVSASPTAPTGPAR